MQNIIKNLLLFLAALLLFGLFYLLNTKNYTSRLHVDREIADLKNYIEDVYKINPYDFKISSLEHFNDSAYQSMSERLLNGGLQLVMYVPENACADCIIREYDKMNFLPGYVQDNTFIMTSFPRVRDVKMWLNSREYRYPVYNSSSFGKSDFGAENQLTLFLVDESGIPANFFIVKRQYPDFSDNYYKHVVSEFAKKHGDFENEDNTPDDEKPEIKVINRHDFGELSLKDKVFTCFEFENTSTVPFHITDISTNCGCTVPEWERKPVGIGETAKVKVEFVAETAGFFSKRITVYSNAKGSPHTLTIVGRVKN